MPLHYICSSTDISDDSVKELFKSFEEGVRGKDNDGNTPVDMELKGCTTLWDMIENVLHIHWKRRNQHWLQMLRVKKCNISYYEQLNLV